MKPAWSHHASLLSTYCVQRGTTSQPQRCWPALTSSPILGRKTDGPILPLSKTQRNGQICVSAVCPHVLQLHFHRRRQQRCLSVKGKFSLHAPIWGRKKQQQKSQTTLMKHLRKEELIRNQDRSNRKGPAGLRGACRQSVPAPRVEGASVPPSTPGSFTLYSVSR